MRVRFGDISIRAALLLLHLSLFADQMLSRYLKLGNSFIKVPYGSPLTNAGTPGPTKKSNANSPRRLNSYSRVSSRARARLIDRYAAPPKVPTIKKGIDIMNRML